MEGILTIEDLWKIFQEKKVYNFFFMKLTDEGLQSVDGLRDLMEDMKIVFHFYKTRGRYSIRERGVGNHFMLFIRITVEGIQSREELLFKIDLHELYSL